MSLYYTSYSNIFKAICLLSLLSCHDFKNWQSQYTNKITIQFSPEKEPIGVLKNLSSQAIESEFFYFNVNHNHETSDQKHAIKLQKEEVELDPNKNQVSFEVYNIHYYSKVIIFYQRELSLISPEAGGMQCKYIIQSIQLQNDAINHNKKKAIFKNKKINNTVPYKDQQRNDTTHVTIYY